MSMYVNDLHIGPRIWLAILTAAAAMCGDDLKLLLINTPRSLSSLVSLSICGDWTFEHFISHLKLVSGINPPR